MTDNTLNRQVLSTQYFIFATNSYGCEEVDSIFIEVIEDIDAYNVFTPNGDDKNDFFVPKTEASSNPKANVSRIDMTIFNHAAKDGQ